MTIVYLSFRPNIKKSAVLLIRTKLIVQKRTIIIKKLNATPNFNVAGVKAKKCTNVVVRISHGIQIAMR